MEPRLPSYPSLYLQARKGTGEPQTVQSPKGSFFVWTNPRFPLSRNIDVHLQGKLIGIFEDADPFWKHRRTISRVTVHNGFELHLVVREITGGLDDGPRYAVCDFNDAIKLIGVLTGPDAAIALAYSLLDLPIPDDLDATIDPKVVTWLRETF